MSLFSQKVQDRRRSGRALAIISVSSLGLYAVGYISCVTLFLLMSADLNRTYNSNSGLFSLLIYVACQIELFGAYIWLLYLWCYRDFGKAAHPRAFLILPVLVSLISIPLIPYFSNDIFSYIAHGYIGSQPGGNPYTQPLYTLANEEISWKLMPLGWTPFHPESPYGGLWSWIEISAYQLGSTVFQSMMFLKVIGTASFLGTAALIHKISLTIRLKDPLLPVVAFLWNPLLIQEFCFEGHNDGLMTFFSVLTLFFSLNNRIGKGLYALAASTLIKYFTICFLPAQIVHHWYKNYHFRMSLRESLVGLAVVGATAYLLYSPFWVGVHTFTGGVKHFDLYLKFPMSIANKIRACCGIAFFCYFTLKQSLKSRTDEQLVQTFSGIACCFFFFVSPKFFPWYLILPVTLLFMSPQRFAFLTGVLLSCIGAISIPADVMNASGFFEIYPAMAWVFSDASVLILCTVAFIAVQLYQIQFHKREIPLQI